MDINKAINEWIIYKLFLLQTKYQKLLFREKQEINLAVKELIDFAKKTVSNEYLELLKITSWDEETKKTALFVFQQLLIMFSPFCPFLSNYLFQTFSKKEITHSTLQKLSKKTRNNWEIECVISLITTARQLKKKEEKIKKIYFQLTKTEEPSFDWNQLFFPLTQLQLLIKKKEELKNDLNFQLLPPFGVIWFETKKKNDSSSKLIQYKKELERCFKLLSNNNFLSKAPLSLVEKEKKKFAYYQEQIKNIQKKERNKK